MESRSQISEKDYIIIQLDRFLSVHGKKSCESRVQSTVQSSPESRFSKGPANHVRMYVETYYVHIWYPSIHKFTLVSACMERVNNLDESC